MLDCVHIRSAALTTQGLIRDLRPPKPPCVAVWINTVPSLTAEAETEVVL